jgi:leader peptidase (prepilin peptidase) / N-methyltransferase
VLISLFLAVQPKFLFAYFIFFSALIVTIRTDLETMLISRYVTIFLIPLAWLLSAFGFLPITLSMSLWGVLFGYGILWITAMVFWLITKKEGMGHGDFELLALIGSFTGIFGCWVTLIIASFAGSLIGICYMMLTGTKHNLKIPFGPFLALGAIIFVLLQKVSEQLFYLNH